MTEPVSATLGIKLSTTIAGFAGGVVSLAFIQNLNRTQAIGAVVVGTLTAAYLTPAILEHFNLGPELNNGAAFVIGLCAMSIIPAIKKAVSRRADEQLGDASTQPTQGDGSAK
ncbi:hypothetical protein DyAD56_15935 [Dyella sp. AD56]|uniref:hypothetical protein n=1 Tax=Dyella sp. AD56 TaxID=1528744 RepID=UPI000CBD62C5|nr:hypothetical protein [Dyella sp. AD56]PMQ04178.1 hypothetical protein DyAD56_15935 [Dyella sp. AD56]